MVEILLVPSEREAEEYQSLGYVHYPPRDVLPLEEIPVSPPVKKKRVEILWRVLNGENVKIVTTLKALLERIMDPQKFKDLALHLKPGDVLKEPEALLSSLGYERTYMIQLVGEFSVRGSIVDVFTPGYPKPARLELFDDKVEEIRLFDVSTQRSVEQLNELFVLPFEDISGDATLWDYSNNSLLFVVKKDAVIEEYLRYRREMKNLVGERYKQAFKEELLEEILKEAKELKMDTGKGRFVRVEREEETLPLSLYDLDEIKEGDLVVHKDHGIAVFEGVVRLKNVLGEKDYLKLKYEDAVLYVPVERIEKVHKYVGDPSQVNVDRLNSTRWKQTVQRVREDVEKRVREIVELYMKRQTIRGLSLTGDPELEEKFAQTFPYIETSDQLKSIEEVLEDLASEKPMDRLLCGDSGFGKTEVALRAIFRTVVSGKQVAVLVPTTVLARQHYENFKERLEPFGVKVELLDGSRTTAEKQIVLEKLKNGEVDVVVGTHALLSDRVSFFDLGLIVIDEEQKFGVEQKEKLKKLRLSVNVLSMSATPIPRTLYMALSGMRDMSVINVPPPGRKPVLVYVMEYNEDVLKAAVLREVNRGGQVIYVHNRVEEFPEVYERLKKLFPGLTVSYAHGKMPKRQLEKVMRDFYEGRLDLLLCTTIVENGIDVPNANTLIVDDAHRYGLGQLYQLRGRVGRSDRRAFAYFFYPKGTPKSALERLKVIRAHTEPGSGLRIALKDMELRGIGDILGIEQHGNVVSIGLKLYNEILRETLHKLRGTRLKEETTADVEMENAPGRFFIPEEYVQNPVERLHLYRRMASAENEEALEELEEELKDRFGPIPEEVALLLKYFRIRIRANSLGIKKIRFDHHLVELYVDERSPFVNHPRYNSRSGSIVLHPKGDLVEFLMNFLKEKGRGRSPSA